MSSRSSDDTHERFNQSSTEDENSSNEEDDSLQRLSELASRRARFNREDEDELNELENLGPASLLRHLMSGRSARFDDEEEEEHGDEEDEEEDDEEEEEDEDFENDDPRAELLRHMAFLSSRGPSESSNRPAGQSFADVMQRLMGSGMIFGDSTGNSEFEGLIENLNQREDPYLILETLNELSEKLLMLNGVTSERVVPANKLARSLVEIMKDASLADHLELQLVACRCLYNFIEVNMDFIHDALNNNAIEILCEKLMEISYIDLSEQALLALEMISRDNLSHNRIITNNGLKAVLQYLDFLTIHAQRKCLTIVANCCSNISSTNFENVQQVFDDIARVVGTHNDPQVIENGWLAISRIIMSFKLKPDFLEDLFIKREGLLYEMVHVIYISANKSTHLSTPQDSNININSTLNYDLNKTPLNYSSMISLIKSLIVLTSVSVDISKILIENCNIGEIIVKSLNKYNQHHKSDNISIESLMIAPNELIIQFLNLIGYLLPISYKSVDTPFLQNNFEEFDIRQNLNDQRCKLYNDNQSYWKFINDIWYLLINTFQATMDYEIRRKVIISLTRIISFCDLKDFNLINNVELITNILASVVNNSKKFILKDFESNDVDMLSEDDDNDVRLEEQPKNISKLHSNVLLLSTFLISYNLIRKSPNLFIQDFEREGLTNDLIQILNALKLQYKANDLEVDNIEDKEELSNSKSNFVFNYAYANKFIDLELINNYETKLTSDEIYQDLVNIGEKIEKLHIDSRDSSNNEYMNILHSINETLNSKSIKNFNSRNWNDLWNTLKLSLKSPNHSISSFELISCGIIESLANLFTLENYEFGFEFNDCYKSFIDVFFNDQSISFFIEKLQDALTRSESFEIISSGIGQSTLGLSGTLKYSSNHDPHTAVMARQVRIRLIAEGESDSNRLPVNMQNMVLSVHAIATFKSIDSFLKQRYRILEEFSRNATPENEDEDQDNEDEDQEAIKNLSDEEIKSPPKILSTEYLINGEVIPNETTIYGAICKSLQNETDEMVDPTKIWSNIHTVTYRKVSSTVEEENNKPITYNSQVLNDIEYDNYDPTTINILKLLKIFFEMNSYAKDSKISNEQFMNWKLTVKLNRQLEDPLVVASGTLPGWSIHITKQFSFIFPLDTRIFFLQSTSFGFSRSIHHWQLRTNQEYADSQGSSNSNSNNHRAQLGRPTRQKVRLSRKSILQSAVKVLQLYGSTPGVLEIEYFDEVGSGLGPTLEFYATVSREFCKKKLKLWRDNSDDNQEDLESYVQSNTGLFPYPLDKNQVFSENGRKMIYFFATLGKFIARALLDSRIIDFNFNPVFLKLVQFFNQGAKPTNRDLKKLTSLNSLRLVDSTLANSLEHLIKYIEAYKDVPIDQRSAVVIDDCTLDDLSLTFTLPGYPDYELIPNGDEIFINHENVENYVNKVLEATLYSGIVHQTKAFMEGFSKVFPINSLIIFSPQELVELLGSAEEDWSLSTIVNSVHANHGYTKESEAIKRLINILVNFNDIEKRSFLQFLTGSPKLPVGGFKSLRPEFTVVRKLAEPGSSDDDYLPSVMTCANYLKLPNYSSEEIMKAKLVQAVNEGAGAFLLS